MLHGVLPHGVEVGIEVLVDGRVLAVGFLYLCTGGRLEVHVQVLRQVPAQLEVAVPQHLTVEVDGQVRILRILQVALLQFIVVTREVGIKGNGLRQVVQTESLGEVQPLRLALSRLERLPGLVDGRVGVVQGATPLVVVLIDGCLARGMAVLVAVADGEVRGVVGHGVTLRLDTDAGVGKREIARHVLGDGNRLDAVALAGTGGIEGILEIHVGIQGVVLRAHLVLADGVINRYGDLGLVGEELAQFEVRRDGVRLLRVGGTLHDALLQSAEAVGDIASRQVDGAEVGELDVQRTRGSPAALVVVLLQAQLVDPHLAGLLLTGKVAHTDNHGLHLAQRGITDDAHLVVGLVVIVLREDL